MSAQHGLGGDGNDCNSPASPSGHTGKGRTDAIVPERLRRSANQIEHDAPGWARRMRQEADRLDREREARS